MPQFVCTTRKFDASVLANGKRVIVRSKSELMTAAARIGDPGILNGYRRPVAELTWRKAMVDASLTEVNRGTANSPVERWAKSESFTRLDPSEKTSVSYFLGMLQSVVVAKELLGVSDLVHVDAVLDLRGIPLAKGRPDLVGYKATPRWHSSPGRVLIEAKGRTNGSDADALRRAKEQVKDSSSIARRLVGRDPLLIASMGYFTGRGEWRGIFEDPPADDEVTPLIEDDMTFQGLLNIASIRPVADAITEIREFAPSRVHVLNRSEMTVATLPGEDWAVGMPTDLFDSYRDLMGPPDKAAPVDDRRATAWAEEITSRRELTPSLRERVTKFHEVDFPAIELDGDGIFVANLGTDSALRRAVNSD